MISEMSLTKDLKIGWSFPYRAKKAHCFVNGQALCGRYRGEGMFSSNTLYTDECCSKCLKKKKELK